MVAINRHPRVNEQKNLGTVCSLCTETLYRMPHSECGVLYYLILRICTSNGLSSCGVKKTVLSLP